MMRMIAGLLVLSCGVFAQSEVIQDFDRDETLPKLAAPLSLSEENPFSTPRCLKLTFGDKPCSAPLPLPVLEVKAGDRIGLSFNYRHTPRFQKITVMIQFRDADGRVLIQTDLPLGRTNGWGRLEKIVSVPDHPAITKTTVAVAAGKLSPDEGVFWDNLRFERNPVEADFYGEKFTLEFFDAWQRRTREQEKFLPGEGGRLFMDWQKSKFGESCFESSGLNTPAQYPWRIYNLKIDPANLYDLRFYYSHTDNYAAQTAMIIVFFRDRDGNTLKMQSRLLLPRTADWSEAKLAIKPPPEAAFMDVAMRFLNVDPAVKLYVNKIRVERGKPEIQVSYQCDPATRTISGSVALFSLPANAAPTVKVLDDTGKTVAAPTLDGGKFTIDLATLPDGRYVIRAEAGDTVGESVFHNYNARPWANLKLGVLAADAPPPPPWTPVRIDAAKLRVATWNPVLEFTPSLALRQATLSEPKTELLTRPIQLVLNGRDIFTALTANKVETGEPSLNHAAFAATLSGDEFDVGVNVRVEFDGMVKYCLRFKARRDLTVNQLDLQYRPVLSEYATTIDGSWSTYNVLVLRDRKQFSSKRFYPMLWNGSLDAGFYSALDKQYPEREYQEQECHLLNYQGDFITKVVNAPLRLAAGEVFELEMAFGVTPFRPPTRSERPFRYRAGKYSTSDLLWPLPEYQPSFGYPRSPENRSSVESWQKKNREMQKFVYQIPFFAMTNLPEYSYFAQAWRELPERIYPPNSLKYPYALFNVDIRQSSWQNLFLRDYLQYLKDNRFDGVYFDCVNIYANREADGRFNYQVFGVRDFLQKIYLVQRQANPGSWSFVHCGSAVTDFCNVFAEIALTGEHYRAECQKYRYYLEFVTLEEFRIQNCGNIGAWRMFLPQFRGPKQEATDVAVHTMGMVLAHDQLLYPSFIRKEVIDNCRNRDYAFVDAGKDGRFQPYWLSGAVVTGNAAVVASSRINSYGVLSFYLNSGKSREKAIVALPAGMAADGTFTIYDPLTGQTDTLSNGGELTLEPYMFKMVLYGNPAIWQ